MDTTCATFGARYIIICVLGFDLTEERIECRMVTEVEVNAECDKAFFCLFSLPLKFYSVNPVVWVLRLSGLNVGDCLTNGFTPIY